MAGTPVRRAPYKDTLQPALHRRFSSTATLLLAVSYLEAVLLADWSSYFWSWFPLGPTGVKTTLIFACGLSILILRIAQYHVGLKTAEGGLQSLGTLVLSLETYETIFGYGLSSLLFAPVFLWSMSDSSNLRWVTYFNGDRARLNERPLFLACYMGCCALLQTVSHYRNDIDRLDLGLSKRKSAQQQANGGGPSSPLRSISQHLPVVLAACLKHAVATLPLTIFLYYLILRSFAWGWALMLLRPFYNLPKTSLLPPSWPADIYLLMRCIYAGTLMNFIWSTGNTAFAMFMVKEPLKNGNPLTSDSKDPNGSLLNGLKSKKLSVKSFAMWELALIAQNFEPRRQAIFADIDRKDGPMWSQVYAICMEAVKAMEGRVDAYGKPPTPVAPQPSAAEPKQRVSAPLREDPIFSNNPGATSIQGGLWDKVARSPGSSPASELSPLAKKTWKNAKDRVLSKDQQEAVSPEHIRGQVGQLAANLMKFEWISAMFRHDFRTEFAAVVLGTPYGEPTLYINAVSALSYLAAHSLAEDQFGNVHRDVPSIIRTLTAVIRKVEALKARFPIHWTDPKGLRECVEVEDVLGAMRTGLEKVVAVFEPYSSDLRLTMGDLRLAKEAATAPTAPTAPTTVTEPARKGRAANTARAAEDKPERRTEAKRNHRRTEMEQVR